jgi:1,4-alpha-glucan branching enzyme
VTDLNGLYRAEPALWELDEEPAGFEWIDSQDAGHNVLSYIRRDRSGRMVAVVVNFAGTPHEGYLLGLPHAGAWREALNTDAQAYGGSGVGNLGRVMADGTPANGRPASVRLRIPPLGALFLIPEGQDGQ